MAPRAGEGFRASMRMVGVTKLLNLFGWALLVAILFDLVRGTTAADVKALRGAMAEKSATAARGEGGFLATYGDDWKEGGVKGTMMLDINKAMASAAANAKADAHEPKWSYEQASQWQPLNDPASPLFKAGFNKWHTSTDGIRFLNEDGVRQVDCKATKPIVHDMRFACNELNAKSTKNGNVKVKAKATASGRKLLQMPPDEFKGFVGVSNVAHGDDGMPVWNTRVPTPPGYVPTPYSQVTHPAVVAAHAAVLGQAVHTIPVHTVQPCSH